MVDRIVAKFVASGLSALGRLRGSGSAHLQLEAKIPLGEVKGRIDHLALDLEHQRLFVAELGNGSVGVVDLASRRVVQRLSGLEEPQGIAWSTATQRLYVAKWWRRHAEDVCGVNLCRRDRLRTSVLMPTTFDSPQRNRCSSDSAPVRSQ